jgi:hypothetical protein
MHIIWCFVFHRNALYGAGAIECIIWRRQTHYMRQVTAQLKILTTAVFSVVILGRTLGWEKAIFYIILYYIISNYYFLLHVIIRHDPRPLAGLGEGEQIRFPYTFYIILLMLYYIMLFFVVLDYIIASYIIQGCEGSIPLFPPFCTHKLYYIYQIK